MDHSKEALRVYFSKKRGALSPEIQDSYSLDIANLCLKLPIWELEYFHLFLPISSKREVDTTLMLTLLQGRDKQIILPKVAGDNVLEHILLTDSTKITNNSWGIPEPQEGIKIDPLQLDVVFIPLLAFDKIGNRVGYGKGFYDRFFDSLRQEPKKIGLSLFDPCKAIEDIADHDMPLTHCVTPQKIYIF